jgi:peptidoglycan/xylan/chitin deacetylase (PgdA/CDA1 family)
MNIFLTYDYELFFGKSAGSVDKCMIEPTNELLKIAKEFNIKMTFFVDIGYLIKLKEFLPNNPELQLDDSKVRKQLTQIMEEGHDIQLHIHPHWEKSYYENGKWVFVTENAYKLADFDQEEINRIVVSYKAFLDEIVGYKTSAFRSGGWCIQPFHKLNAIFQEVGIKYDSSVFPGGSFSSTDYSFDFTNAPTKSHYSFNDDECQEVENGPFVEYPISSRRYSPIFYWRLYILGRLFPSQHKMIGDGDFLAQPGRKKSVLTNFTWNHISTDGFYASKLEKTLNSFEQNNIEDMVVIGHPKGMTFFSLKATKKFISKAHTKHVFRTFKELI